MFGFKKKRIKGDEKKMTLDEILKGIAELPEEEKVKVKAKMDDIYKAEDEREIDKMEKEKTDDKEVKDEKSEEVKDESEEIGKDVKEVETEEKPEEETKSEADEKKEIDNAQMARIEAIEGEISALKEKIETMIDNFDKRDFGLTQSAPTGGDRNDERYDAVMRGYAGDSARNYK